MEQLEIAYLGKEDSYNQIQSRSLKMYWCPTPACTQTQRCSACKFGAQFISFFQACFTHSANFISRCEHFPRNKGLPCAPMAESIWTQEDRQQLAKPMEKAERHGQSLAVFSGPPATSFCDDASDFFCGD